MRKAFFISFTILVIGCNKEINSGSVNSGSINQAQTGSLIADTYLPLTKGTYWKYNIKTDSKNPETSKLTVLNLPKKINAKNYQAVKSVINNKADTLYYAQDQHDYYLYTNTGTSDADKINLEILFLKDNASVGDTWLLPAGTANGFNLKCYGKIIETDASVTAGGATYNHVIHSYVEIRKPFFFTYIVANRQDFYTAKNIGIVKNVSDILFPASSTTITNITDYKINK